MNDAPAESHPAFRLTAALQDLLAARDIPRVAQVATFAARELAGADAAAFYLFEDGHSHCVEEAATAPLRKGRRVPLERSAAGWMARNATALLIEDLGHDPRVPPEEFQGTFVKGLALLPLHDPPQPSERRPIGVIGAYWAAPHLATPAELQLLQALADGTASALASLQAHAALTHRLSAQTATAEMATQDLEAFGYTITHDLRAPVRHVAGFAELLATSGDCNGKALGHLARIRAAAERMHAQIEGLHALTKLSVRPVRRIRLDFSALASEVAAALAAADPSRQVFIDIAPNLHAEGDPGLLRHALEHLFGNSWKFTAKTTAPRIEFGRTEGATAEFFVRDNGAGFSMENTDRLFQPFGRLHGEADFPGLGIGLAAVRRVILKHGGSLRAESAPGQGASFFFTLP